MADLGPHNLQGNEVLVYIRRINKDAPPPPNWIGYDYHLMSSLPTNDNPRYSFGEHNPDMTTKYGYFYRFDTGPVDYLKIQIGQYPEENITGIVQVKLYNPDNTSDTFYQQFKTSKEEQYDYISFKEAQIGIINEYDNLIDYSGIPEIKFALLSDVTKTIKSEAEFNKLNVFPNISGVPRLVDQTGIIKIANPSYNESVTFFYQGTYSKSFQICEFESVSKDLTPYEIIVPEILDFAPRVVDKGNAQNSRGVIIDTPPSPVVKAKPVGTQLHKIPLHEITNSIRKVDCKSTHLAYLIGPVSTYGPREFIGQSNPDGTYKIYAEMNPATYLFTASSSFYKRLPECWPWSCRRWTVEKNQDSEGNWIINYFSQDYIGNKISVSYNEIPKIRVDLYAINGQSESKYLPILNGDPTSTTPYSVVNPDGDSTFVDGYLLSKLNLDMNTMDEIKLEQCGCSADDEKIELAVEMFPLLYDAQCKLILKTGYLCYRTEDCQNPSPGVINKKIITPFNSCRFNEVLAVDLDKMSYPSNSIASLSITFDQKPGAIVSYLKTPNQVSFDPYTHPSGVSLSISSGPQTISVPAGYTGYLSIVGRFPCMYSSDIYVYKVINGDLTKVATYPNNEVYNCPQNYLAYSVVQGNGTDQSEDLNTITTGDDYYIANNKHIRYNDTDPVTSYEKYKISSLGNAGGFLNLQSICCDMCVNTDGVYKANDACFALDIEHNDGYINQFLRTGSCDNSMASRCDSNIINGRATLRAYADMPIDYIFGTVLAASGSLTASGIIRPIGDSTMNATGIIYPTGVIRILGDSSMIVTANVQPQGEII